MIRFRFLAKWFAIGFAFRLGLAVIVFLLALRNWEAVMLNLADFPTMGGIWLLEQGPGLGRIGGGDPYYIAFNLFAGTVWGLMFALFASIVQTIRSRRMKHSVA